jgi:predicted transcriptional regulator
VSTETVIELSQKQLEALTKLSKERKRSKDALLLQVVEEYLEKSELEQDQSIQELDNYTEREMKSWNGDTHELAEIDELETPY